MALEAINSIKTVQQIAKEFDVHPVQVSDWKKKLSEHASSVFDTGKEWEQEDFGEKRTVLHPKIEELSVQVDFLVEKSKQLGVWIGLPNSTNHNTRS